ncbi:hypothetical protein A2U01_0008088, partial [Trifolium medium]|nr:hypothetical protein [Trifolium medium]
SLRPKFSSPVSRPPVDSSANRPSSGLLPTPSPPQNKPRFRHLSEVEMAERREKGLCFNCDQRWSRQHNCRGRLFLLVTDSDDEPPSVLDLEASIEDVVSQVSDPPNQAQLSLHAIAGTQHIDTFRISGTIANHTALVLVDGGSTHNFIQESVAVQLGLNHSPIPPLHVMVGNGQELLCSKVCLNVPIILQGHEFLVDLHMLGLKGADIVLGAHWLKQLGPVIMDYQHLSMKFFHNNSCVELIGNSSSLPPPLTLHQFQKFMRHEPEAQLFSLRAHSIDPIVHATSPTSLDNPQLTELLRQFEHLFSEPTHLPPPRLTDHKIPLLSNSSPVNVRPYRYPHSQKLEIESQVTKMLQSGWIQPSTSPYSSPVLLLKKKDGSWRMCVDYRALNAITVPDRFPLPTIDELLDELGHARFFSKLDLTSGFHQIRLDPNDAGKTAFRTHDGHYEYNVMPFGLCNAPATFQSTMNDIFRPLLRRSVIVFFDDILVFSTTMEQHLQHLRQVFEILDEHQFHLKDSKCSFGQTQVSYLGHIVAEGVVSPDPLKIQ